jgi:hypothetical protein
MADRRADDTPLAPRRTLSGPSHASDANGDTGKRPLSERVSNAVAAAGSAVQQAASSSAANRSSGAGGSTRSSSTGSSRTSATSATSATRPVGATPRPRGTRRARLRLVHLDPWSVMKTSFLLSIAFGIVTVVSVFLVWSVLGAAGVWSSINNTVSDTVSSGNNVSDFNIEDYLGMSRVLGFTMLVSVIDVILITAIATLGAFLYNMAASLLGGIEVTLAEDN